jgi:hypothetical protein
VDWPRFGHQFDLKIVAVPRSPDDFLKSLLIHATNHGPHELMVNTGQPPRDTDAEKNP